MSSHHIETCTCACAYHIPENRHNTSNQARVKSENSYKRPCEDYDSEMPSDLGSVCSCEQFSSLPALPRIIVQQLPTQAARCSVQASDLWSRRPTSHPVAERIASFSSPRPEDRHQREEHGGSRQVEEDHLRRLTNEDGKAIETENIWWSLVPFNDYQGKEKCPTCSWTGSCEGGDSFDEIDSELSRDLEALDRMIRQVEVSGPSNAIWHDNTTPDAGCAAKRAKSKKPATTQNACRIPRPKRFLSTEKAAENTDEDFGRYTPPLLSYSSARYPSTFHTSPDRIEAAQIELEKADGELIRKESKLATASAKYRQASSKLYALLREQYERGSEEDDFPDFWREQERRNTDLDATCRRRKKSAGSSW
ncbi:hypothetical protein HBI52_133870 [Parastagonospora nodorum]|nr:hypothetical protein HBI52_133870 [Parastagonospora nodorum]